MEAASEEPIKKKRTVNKAEWLIEKRKKLRTAGKEYVNRKGQVVKERKPGPDCRCRRKCYVKVNEETRQRLFKAYYALKSYDEQSAYLYGLIRKVPIAKKTVESSTKRTCTFQYFIRFNGQETQVCRTALENIHAVSTMKIHYLCDKLGQNVLFPRDERGHHTRTPKVSGGSLQLVKAHMYSIIRTERGREFLKDDKANNGPDLNVMQMYKDYLDTNEPDFVKRLAEYEKVHGSAEPEPEPETQQPSYQNADQTWDFSSSYNRDQYTNQRLNCAQEPQNTQQHAKSQEEQSESAKKTTPTSRRWKETKDGPPKPLIRQWFYRKTFHDIFTGSEANAFRKKAMEWKSSGDYVPAKVARKPRSPRTTTAPPKPTKKKSAQVAGTSSTDMYSMYPKILQDLSRLEAHNVPIPHFQGQPGYTNEQRPYRPIV